MAALRQWIASSAFAFLAMTHCHKTRHREGSFISPPSSRGPKARGDPPRSGKLIERGEQPPVADFERVGADALFGGFFQRAAAVDVKPAAVIRAFHGFAFDTAEVQRHVVVRAEVVEQAQLAGFGADQEQVATFNDNPLEVAGFQFVRRPKIKFSHA
jgi:hypothetical protein